MAFFLALSNASTTHKEIRKQQEIVWQKRLEHNKRRSASHSPTKHTSKRDDQQPSTSGGAASASKSAASSKKHGQEYDKSRRKLSGPSGGLPSRLKGHNETDRSNDEEPLLRLQQDDFSLSIDHVSIQSSSAESFSVHALSKAYLKTDDYRKLPKPKLFLQNSSNVIERSLVSVSSTANGSTTAAVCNGVGRLRLHSADSPPPPPLSPTIKQSTKFSNSAVAEQPDSNTVTSQSELTVTESSLNGNSSAPLVRKQKSFTHQKKVSFQSHKQMSTPLIHAELHRRPSIIKHSATFGESPNTSFQTNELSELSALTAEPQQRASTDDSPSQCQDSDQAGRVQNPESANNVKNFEKSAGKPDEPSLSNGRFECCTCTTMPGTSKALPKPSASDAKQRHINPFSLVATGRTAAKASEGLVKLRQVILRIVQEHRRRKTIQTLREIAMAEKERLMGNRLSISTANVQPRKSSTFDDITADPDTEVSAIATCQSSSGATLAKSELFEVSDDESDDGPEITGLHNASNLPIVCTPSNIDDVFEPTTSTADDGTLCQVASIEEDDANLVTIIDDDSVFFSQADAFEQQAELPLPCASHQGEIESFQELQGPALCVAAVSSSRSHDRLIASQDSKACRKSSAGGKCRRSRSFIRSQLFSRRSFKRFTEPRSISPDNSNSKRYSQIKEARLSHNGRPASYADFTSAIDGSDDISNERKKAIVPTKRLANEPISATLRRKEFAQVCRRKSSSDTTIRKQRSTKIQTPVVSGQEGSNSFKQQLTKQTEALSKSCIRSSAGYGLKHGQHQDQNKDNICLELHIPLSNSRLTKACNGNKTVSNIKADVPTTEPKPYETSFCYRLNRKTSREAKVTGPTRFLQSKAKHREGVCNESYDCGLSSSSASIESNSQVQLLPDHSANSVGKPKVVVEQRGSRSPNDFSRDNPCFTIVYSGSDTEL